MFPCPSKKVFKLRMNCVHGHTFYPNVSNSRFKFSAGCKYHNLMDLFLLLCTLKCFFFGDSINTAYHLQAYTTMLKKNMI